ncbi:MAG: hypothetical protein AAGB19_00200 [Cyanobacteria bacterium P01_F01_bin.3]
MTQQFEGQRLIVLGGTSDIGKSVAQLVLQGGICRLGRPTG